MHIDTSQPLEASGVRVSLRGQRFPQRLARRTTTDPTKTLMRCSGSRFASAAAVRRVLEPRAAAGTQRLSGVAQRRFPKVAGRSGPARVTRFPTEISRHPPLAGRLGPPRSIGRARASATILQFFRPRPRRRPVSKRQPTEATCRLILAALTASSRSRAGSPTMTASGRSRGCGAWETSNFAPPSSVFGGSLREAAVHPGT